MVNHSVPRVERLPKWHKQFWCIKPLSLRIFHMPDERFDKDIRDVMAEEKSRGKRPLDSKARKEKAELLRQVREALCLDTEMEFSAGYPRTAARRGPAET